MRPTRTAALVIVFLFVFATTALAFKATLRGEIVQVKDGDAVVVSP
jgi:hypothetical protein